MENSKKIDFNNLTGDDIMKLDLCELTDNEFNKFKDILDNRDIKGLSYVQRMNISINLPNHIIFRRYLTQIKKEFAKLEQEIIESKQKITKLEQENIESKQEKKELKEEKKELKEENKKLEQKNEKLGQENEELKEDIKELKSQNQALQNNFNQLLRILSQQDPKLTDELQGLSNASSDMSELTNEDVVVHTFDTSLQQDPELTDELQELSDASSDMSELTNEDVVVLTFDD